MKKNGLSVLLLIAGILIGWLISTFIRSDDNIKFASIANDKMQLSPDFLSRKIDTQLARHYISEFVKDSSKHRLKAITKENQVRALRGFWINREAIESVLKQDTLCNGIRIYLAKHPLSDEKYAYTFVFVGTKPDGTKRSGSETDILENMEVYDFVDPCPKNCGTYGGN